MSYPYQQQASGSSMNPRQTYPQLRGLGFIETAQYNAVPPLGPPANPNLLPVVFPWRQYQHPNGDIYFYNIHLRLITSENIRLPRVLQYLNEARDDHLECLQSDPNVDRLPRDYELIITELDESVATIRMFSRIAQASYIWTEETGLTMLSKAHFWTHVAEFPSHHQNLPPNTEEEFAEALEDARLANETGSIFPFSPRQIEQIGTRYRYLTNLRSQGHFVTPSLAWLIGAVMPLDTTGRRVDDRQLQDLVNGHYNGTQH